jgi:hypothetical protein
MSPLPLKRLVALLAVLIEACGMTHPATTSNTNWLRKCGSSRICAGDQICTCGVCTVACTENAGCRRADGPAASCVSLAEAQCGHVSKGAVCAARCQRDSQCELDLACIAGGCVQTMSVAGNTVDASLPAMTREAGEPATMPDAGALTTPEAGEPATMPDAGAGRDAQVGSSTATRVSGEIRRMIVTQNDAFLLDQGTMDPLGNTSADGAILRVNLGTGAIDAVVSGIDRPWELLVDANRVYWSEGADGGPYTLWTADRNDGTNKLRLASVGNLAWTQSATHIYFVTQEETDQRFDLFRLEKGTPTVEKMTDENWQGGNGIALDAQYVYVYTGGWGNYRVPVAGGAPESINDGGDSAAAFDRSHVFYIGTQGDSISIADKTGGNPLTIATIKAPSYLWDIRPFREHIYFSVLSGDSTAEAMLHRGPLIPGTDEVLAMFPEPSGMSHAVAFDVSDQGLFWMEGDQLKHKVIGDDTSTQVSPQGALGGPCFNDLACNPGLACIKLACE